MPALETPLRRTLERQVIAARDTAEIAAEAALARLLVDNGRHGDAGNLGHLNDDERRLRKALLAKEKQLGSRDALIRECAYEQWHAMLFARFLEASGLLMHPEHGEPVKMGDLTELAEEEGDADAYAAAARYAAHMLPGIFRPSDPLLRVRFAHEHRERLEALIEGIPRPAFTADDGLGWVYQFWQTKRKQEINASGRKIGGADIPPVTQLFTEHYMVQFMLHNTVGAWWTARHPDQPLPTEKSYLRVNDDGTPVAGPFPGWPATVKELKVLDPCCGSGHFLVAAFALLRRLRMLEEGLSEAEAAEAVLRDNLHGLELDPRCTQLAAFNLTLETWKAGGYRKLPAPNIACSGLSIGSTVEDWLPFAPDDTARNVFRVLHDEFKDAPNLGSLINPRAGIQQRLGMFGEQVLEGLPELLDVLLSREQVSDPAAAIYSENVQGVTRAARLLGATYHLVITNVPYLARGRQAEALKRGIEERYGIAKADLATAAMERARDFTAPGGTYSLVTPQNWLFLGSYKRLREELLKEQTWDWVARLGTGAFETISGEVVNVSLVTLTNKQPARTHELMGLDASEGRTTDAKDAVLREGQVLKLGQEGQRGNIDSVITFDVSVKKYYLGDYAESFAGIQTGDYPRFGRVFWEVAVFGETWEFQRTATDERGLFGGMSNILRWERNRGELREFVAARLGENSVGTWLRGHKAWGKTGVTIGLMRELPSAAYLGELYDDNVAVIIPKSENNVLAILCFAQSDQFNEEVRKINQNLVLKTGYLLNIPFDLPYWQQVAAEKYPHGLPEPYSNDPTQWLFRGTVTDTTEPLHVAMARLCGYAWPEQVADGITPDADGIVPLPPLLGEKAAHERLLDTLAGVYGAEWNAAKLRELLAQVGADSPEGWLREKFFEQHARLFHHRPFLWHIWDGKKDGFSAVVNYHTLDRARLEKLTYVYLGAWIDRQRAASGAGEKGADVRLAAALGLQKKLEAILLGEPPYDIYVRWKELEEQPRGWNPDLNDGVRLNIRPFVEAGVLRAKVNVKWGKDRGSDPGKKDFGERGPQTDLEKHQSNERHNDLHFTLKEKEEARTKESVGA